MGSPPHGPSHLVALLQGRGRKERQEGVVLGRCCGKQML